MNEVLFLVEKSIEGGYTARALDQFIFTEADDLEALRRQVRNAVHCHFGEQNASDHPVAFYTTKLSQHK